MNDIQKLNKYKFRKAGNWMINQKGKLDIQYFSGLENSYNVKDVVYAFVVGNHVMYVGESERSFKERSSDYKGGHGKSSGSTNKKIYAEILRILTTSDLPVDIYIRNKTSKYLMEFRHRSSIRHAIEYEMISIFETEKDGWNGKIFQKE